MTIGERIKQARKASNFSLRKLADEIGVSAMAISKYERDQDVPSSGVLLRLSQALQVKVDFFFRPSTVSVQIQAYRKHAVLGIKEQEAIQMRIQDWVERAWIMAVINRHPPADLLHHSDRGSQYTSEVYWSRLLAAQCQVSMSRTGNCYDNAAMESFFATLKGECATRPFQTKSDAQTSIFEYIEVWYNRQRFHSSLGYLSPVEFEQLSGH